MATSASWSEAQLGALGALGRAAAMCRMPLGIEPSGPDISPSLTVTAGDVSHAAGHRAR